MLNISVSAVKVLRSDPRIGPNHYGRVHSLTHDYRDLSHWVPVLLFLSPPPIHHFPHLLSSSCSSSFPAVLTCHVYLISFPREEVFRFWRWWWWRRCVCVCVLMPGWFIKANRLHLTDGQGEEFTWLYTFVGLQQSELFLFFGCEVVPDESKSGVGSFQMLKGWVRCVYC